MPYKLHDYQELAVGYVQERRRAGLFLDMGLGKTAICLSALTPDRLPALVCAPKRVAEEVWGPERDKWRPDLTIAVAKGTPKARAAALRSGADVVVISRDNLADVLDAPVSFRTFIIDELSGYKNRSTLRWKTANKVAWAPGMENFWGLTGTPSPNGYLDLWPQIALMDKGERLGKNITAYRERYFTPGRQLPSGVITDWDIRPGAEERINHLIQDICLSMKTEGRVKLPPVTFNNVSVPLNPTSRRIYKELKKSLVVDLDMISGAGEVHTASTAASLSQKLSQITAGFLYVDEADLRDHEYDVIHRDKVAALREIIEGTGSPVLVAYRYQAELALIKEGLGEMAHTLDEDGVIPAWNAGQVPVLLVHPASAGHGLNLQHGGHTLVWTSVPWSLEEYQQTNKRLARQGQEHPVIIHHLISPHTVDESVLQALEDKRSIQQALLDHLESPI